MPRNSSVISDPGQSLLACRNGKKRQRNHTYIEATHGREATGRRPETNLILATNLQLTMENVR
jgi:hypothetical protein